MWFPWVFQANALIISWCKPRIPSCKSSYSYHTWMSHFIQYYNSYIWSSITKEAETQSVKDYILKFLCAQDCPCIFLTLRFCLDGGGQKERHLTSVLKVSGSCFGKFVGNSCTSLPCLTSLTKSELWVINTRTCPLCRTWGSSNCLNLLCQPLAVSLELQKFSCYLTNTTVSAAELKNVKLWYISWKVWRNIWKSQKYFVSTVSNHLTIEPRHILNIEFKVRTLLLGLWE
jgi:hypothetical protein